MKVSEQFITRHKGNIINKQPYSFQFEIDQLKAEFEILKIQGQSDIFVVHMNKLSTEKKPFS